MRSCRYSLVICGGLFSFTSLVGFVPQAVGQATTSIASDYLIPSYAFATPVFGLAAAPDGSLLVADAGAGIVQLRKGAGSLIVELPGITDVAPIGRSAMFAVRGGGPGATTGALFRVSPGLPGRLPISMPSKPQ